MAEDLVLGVDFDLSQVEKAINKMQSQFNSAAKEMEKLPKVIADLDARIEEINQKEEAGVKLTQEEKNLRDSLVNQSATYAARLQEVTERAAQLGSELENARMDPSGFAQANGLIDSTADSAGQAADETSRIGTNAHKASSGFKNASQSANLMTKGVSSAASGMAHFANRVAGLAKRVFIFSVITRALRKIREGFGAVISSNERLSSTLSRVRGNLSVAFQPLIQKAIPYIEKFCHWIEIATQYLAAFIHRLTGANIKTSIQNAKKLHDAVNNKGKSSQYDGQIKAIDKQIKAYQKQIKALQADEKAMKKQYEAEKKVLDKKKAALNEQIDGIEDYIATLKKQEKAEQKAVDAQRDAISQQIKMLQSQKKARQEELDEQRKAADAQVDAVNKEIKALQKQKRAREKALREEDRSLAGFDTMQILSGSEDEDPEIQAIDAQIEALEEKRDALQEIADAIPADSDDPFIQQIEAQIEALQAQKDAIEDVDYSPMIEQQQSLIEGLEKSVQNLDNMASKLQEEHEIKLDVKEEAIDQLQAQIDKLNEEKDKLNELKDAAEDTSNGFDTSLGDMDTSSEKFNEMADKCQKVIIALGIIIAVIGLLTGNPFAIIGGLALLFVGLSGDAEGAGTKVKNAMKKILEKLDKLSTWADENRETLDLVSGIVIGFLAGLAAYNTAKFASHIITGFSYMSNTAIAAYIGIGLLAAGIIYLTQNWDNLTGFQRAVTIFGAIAAAAAAAAIAIMLFHTAWTVGVAAAAIAGGLALLGITYACNSYNAGKDEAEKAQQTAQGFYDSYDFSKPIQIPGLARGAVIPGGKPWIAMLGDQPAGQTNVEAPLDTIKQALAEVLTESGGEDITVHVSFERSESAFIRYMQPKFEVERKRQSAFAE